MDCLHLGFVGSGRGYAGSGVGVEVASCVERDGWGALLLGNGLPDHSRRGDAKAIVRNGQSMRGAKFRLQLCLQLFVHRFWQRRLRLAVDAQNLLADSVRPASEEAGLCGRCPALDAQDAGDVHTFASEIRNKCFSGRIVSDGANGKDARAEGSKVVSGIGPAAGSEMRLAVAEDQDWRFA